MLPQLLRMRENCKRLERLPSKELLFDDWLFLLEGGNDSLERLY